MKGYNAPHTTGLSGSPAALQALPQPSKPSEPSKPKQEQTKNGKPRTMTTKRCKDCTTAGITTRRPTPHPGPRCTTHHRNHTKTTRKQAADRRIHNTYGLTPDQYDTIYKFQGGRCYICQKATGKTRRLAVDHDHQTGNIRGLCCKTCNTVILGRYNIAALTRAITYLLDPPAPQALGGTITVPPETKTTTNESDHQ